MEEHLLNDTWSFYFHDPNDSDWSKSSFRKIADCSSIEQYWGLESKLAPKLHLGMFFIMRDGIFPLWEETGNKEGGYLSIKVLKTKVSEVWEDLCSKLLSESILRQGHKDRWDTINGLSVSPKKSFCIIKIWLKTRDLKEKHMYHLNSSDYTDVLFKSYAEENGITA